MSIAFESEPDRSRGRRMPVVAAMAAVAAMAVVGGRAHLVRAAPRTAVLFQAIGIPVNLSGLTLEGVRAKVLADGDRRVLVVEGEIVNPGERDEIARPLAVSVRGAANEALYAWTTRASQQKVAAGERVAFLARLAAPPTDGREVVVEFDRSAADASPVAKPGVRQRSQGSRTESQ